MSGEPTQRFDWSTKVMISNGGALAVIIYACFQPSMMLKYASIVLAILSLGYTVLSMRSMSEPARKDGESAVAYHQRVTEEE